MTTLAAPAASDQTHRLLDRFTRSRAVTHRLAQPLSREDMVVQTSTDVSPTKWHLAHTTWFYERFVLRRFIERYEPFHERYEYLFNSYYDTVGPQHCRAHRGLVSRPGVEEVFAYRGEIDRRVSELITEIDAPHFDELAMLIELGVQHEQQHQELIATDIKHVLSSNPLLPAYHEPASTRAMRRASRPPAPRWRRFEEGVYEIGYDGEPAFESFCFDNETPRHRVYLHGFELADRLVTNGEYLAFLQDGGYDRPELWLSMGFATIRERGWRHPLYWYRDGDRWMQYTLLGPRALDLAEPVSHLSYFEADAFARWAGARLPREAEWEVAAADHPSRGRTRTRGGCIPSRCGSGAIGPRRSTPTHRCTSSTATCGSGRSASTSRTRATGRCPARWASTTASSCAISSSSAAPPARHPRTTPG